MNFAELTPEERLIAEQAVLNLRSLNNACNAAADGTLINVDQGQAQRRNRKTMTT